MTPVLIFCKTKVLYDSLRGFLMGCLSIDLELIDDQSLLAVRLFSQKHIILLDMNAIDASTIELLVKVKEVLDFSPKLIFINVARNELRHKTFADAETLYLDQTLADMTKILKRSLCYEIDNNMDIELTQEKLTKREKQVLDSLIKGSSNLEISESLFVSESTVKTHLYRIFKKIGVSTRSQAIVWAQGHLYNQEQSA
nr:LuxR C-terminal-related transcriptional regulator [Paraferrimonas sp. SM1919]